MIFCLNGFGRRVLQTTELIFLICRLLFRERWLRTKPSGQMNEHTREFENVNGVAVADTNQDEDNEESVLVISEPRRSRHLSSAEKEKAVDSEKSKRSSRKKNAKAPDFVFNTSKAVDANNLSTGEFFSAIQNSGMDFLPLDEIKNHGGYNVAARYGLQCLSSVNMMVKDYERDTLDLMEQRGESRRISEENIVEAIRLKDELVKAKILSDEEMELARSRFAKERRECEFKM